MKEPGYRIRTYGDNIYVNVKDLFEDLERHIDKRNQLLLMDNLPEDWRKHLEGHTAAYGGLASHLRSLVRYMADQPADPEQASKERLIEGINKALEDLKGKHTPAERCAVGHLERALEGSDML